MSDDTNNSTEFYGQPYEEATKLPREIAERFRLSVKDLPPFEVPDWIWAAYEQSLKEGK